MALSPARMGKAVVSVMMVQDRSLCFSCFHFLLIGQGFQDSEKACGWVPNLSFFTLFPSCPVGTQRLLWNILLFPLNLFSFEELFQTFSPLSFLFLPSLLLNSLCILFITFKYYLMPLNIFPSVQFRIFKHYFLTLDPFSFCITRIHLFLIYSSSRFTTGTFLKYSISTHFYISPDISTPHFYVTKWK